MGRERGTEKVGMEIINVAYNPTNAINLRDISLKISRLGLLYSENNPIYKGENR